MGEEGPNQTLVLGFTPKISQKHEKWSSLSPFFQISLCKAEKKTTRAGLITCVYEV